MKRYKWWFLTQWVGLYISATKSGSLNVKGLRQNEKKVALLSIGNSWRLQKDTERYCWTEWQCCRSPHRSRSRDRSRSRSWSRTVGSRLQHCWMRRPSTGVKNTIHCMWWVATESKTSTLIIRNSWRLQTDTKWWYWTKWVCYATRIK